MIKTRLTKSCLKIIGGKSKIREELYKLFPKDHDMYLEPFLGSGTIILGKEKSKFEIVGDINPWIVGFFQTMQDYPEALWKRLQFSISGGIEKFEEGYGKSLFLSYREVLDSPFSIEDKYEMQHVNKAVAFYIINKTCMNGILRWNKSGKCNSSYCGTWKGRGWLDEEWFWEIYERIKDVVFINTSFKHIIGHYSGKNTFVFADPPYVGICREVPDGNVTTYNGIKFTLEDQKELFDCLSRLDKEKWLLTINDCKWIRDLYKDFNIQENLVNYSCSQSKKGRGDHKELIIRNYE